MAEIDETIREFLIESREGLDQVDQDLVALEQNPRDRQILARVFRCIHTVKGTCGFLGFAKLEKVSHSGENLLGLLRDQKLFMTPEIATALLTLIDAMRRMLSAIEQSGMDGDEDSRGLIDTLDRLATTPQDAAAPPSAPAPMPAAAAPAPQAAPAAPPADDEPEEEEKAKAAPAAAAESSVAESAIRVDVALLDKLMNLVGELVLARNQVLQFNQVMEDVNFLNTTARLNLITSELQESVMKTRMQHIGHIWSRTPRLVRDLARAAGKDINLTMEGKDTELDKTLIEAIRDPLTHIIRNSVDHGLELPADRLANGKPARGNIHMRAFHEGGQVNMEISDDGRGIDPEKVRRKALEKGVVSPDQALAMSERELVNLIFLPGFSTKEQITNISGRGVGMDVVKTNIEKIGGTVDIKSVVGEGTTIRVKIPLTLAIIPALIVTQSGERFAIPQVNLVELVRLEGESAHKDVQLLHSVPVYRLRGRLLPLVYLHRELGGITGPFTANELVRDDAVNIVVLQADDRTFGLVVDDINDTVEIVVKPLGNLLKGLPVFAGATIMGDGRVALILDVLGVAQRAGVLAESRERLIADNGAEKAAAKDERIAVILFRAYDDGRMAVPLSDMERLEVFPKSIVEHTGDVKMIQYRDEMLPLINVSSTLRERRKIPRGGIPFGQDDDTVHVVVHNDNGRRVGVVVGRILDVVAADVSVQLPAARDGVKFSAVLQDRITEFLDLQWIVEKANTRMFKARAAKAEAP